MLPDRVSNPGPLTYESGAECATRPGSLQSYQGTFEYCRLTLPYLILISKNVLRVNVRKNNGKRTGNQMPGILP